MESLPKEIIAYIFTFTRHDVKSAIAFRMLNKYIYQVCNMPGVSKSRLGNVTVHQCMQCSAIWERYTTYMISCEVCNKNMCEKHYNERSEVPRYTKTKRICDDCILNLELFPTCSICHCFFDEKDRCLWDDLEIEYVRECLRCLRYMCNDCSASCGCDYTRGQDTICSDCIDPDRDTNCCANCGMDYW